MIEFKVLSDTGLITFDARLGLIEFTVGLWLRYALYQVPF